VLHLAVASGHSGTYEDDGFNDERFDVNAKGTFHVFESACRAGVQRVVHVSSLMVVWGYGKECCVAGDALPRPVGTMPKTAAWKSSVCVSRPHSILLIRASAGSRSGRSKYLLRI
jgi:nucleoside-diphosphate-sugar epimerase